MLTMVMCTCNQSDLYAKTNVKASLANINNDMKIMFSKQMSQMTNTNVKCQSLPSSLHSHPIAFFLSPPIGDSFNEFQLTWVMFGGILGSWVLSHLNNFKLKITVMFNSLSFDSQFNSVLLLFHKVMDYTVLKLGRYAKCTSYSHIP